MQVSSGLPLPAENIPPVFLVEPGQLAEPCQVEDEEFPPDIPAHYDWMLQPASRRSSRRLTRVVAVLVAAFLIAISILAIHKLSSPSPSVLASPHSPLS
jgi:hypothetical protein